MAIECSIGHKVLGSGDDDPRSVTVTAQGWSINTFERRSQSSTPKAHIHARGRGPARRGCPIPSGGGSDAPEA